MCNLATAGGLRAEVTKTLHIKKDFRAWPLVLLLLSVQLASILTSDKSTQAQRQLRRALPPMSM